MLLESLYTNEKRYFIGMTELRNKYDCSRDTLLQKTREIENDVLMVQFLNPRLIAGSMHLLSAAQNALNAWHGGYAISRSLGVEVLVHSSGQRQITRSLHSHGISDGMEQVGIVSIGGNREDVSESLSQIIVIVGEEIVPPFHVDDDRFQLILEHYEIDPDEITLLCDSENSEGRLESLEKAVVSRVSLVSLDT